jgi:hypothetical protein
MAKAVETALFCSDKGGVGKTLVASLRIARHQMQHGKLPTIVEVESDPRLSLVFGKDNVHFFPVETDPAKIEADSSLVYGVWDRVADVAKSSKTPVVLDVGANLLRPFAHYCAEAGDYGPWGTGGNVSAFAVTTGEGRAVSSARAALFHLAQALPQSRRFLVLNERDARLFPLDAESAGVKAIVAETGAAGVLRVPCCTSAAFAEVTDRAMPLAEAVKHEPGFWEKECGLAGPAAARAAHRLAVFLRDGVAAFDAVYGSADAAVA